MKPSPSLSHLLKCAREGEEAGVVLALLEVGGQPFAGVSKGVYRDKDWLHTVALLIEVVQYSRDLIHLLRDQGARAW